ncbi:MAG: DUF4102 domain-containing protein [Rhizobiales bacterium]|nr:Arm DNA-binding domain-containing protein [Hyphomicrobiales bacterium]NRB14514.1 DUF4102 domain-containing protein [Hyphomicrobiales bacterium]
MARQVNKLSDRGVKAARVKGRYADGNGLYLQVGKSGTKSWLFRYMLDKRSREMGLGSVQTVSLAKARAEALQCKKSLHEGIYPIRVRNERLKVNTLFKKYNIFFREYNDPKGLYH